MRKKLMFLVATALLVVNVIYLVKAENCVVDADCVHETADSGYTVKCVYGVCKVVPDGGFGPNPDVVIGAKKCVCKNGNCQASNFISFRALCGSGSTDFSCSVQYRERTGSSNC
jgi:hypothetical protein